MALSFTLWITVLFGRGQIICYVQYFHCNVVLVVFGIKHFKLVIWSSLSFLVPLHYHLYFNKWNEKPSKVSAKTQRENIPFHASVHSSNTYWAQTKCQLGCQFLGIKRTTPRFPDAEAGWTHRGEWGPSEAPATRCCTASRRRPGTREWHKCKFRSQFCCKVGDLRQITWAIWISILRATKCGYYCRSTCLKISVTINWNTAGEMLIRVSGT